MPNPTQSPFHRVLRHLPPDKIISSQALHKMEMVACGGYGDVYHGELTLYSLDGTSTGCMAVAIKDIRANLKKDKPFKIVRLLA